MNSINQQVGTPKPHTFLTGFATGVGTVSASNLNTQNISSPDHSTLLTGSTTNGKNIQSSNVGGGSITGFSVNLPSQGDTNIGTTGNLGGTSNQLQSRNIPSGGVFGNTQDFSSYLKQTTGQAQNLQNITLPSGGIATVSASPYGEGTPQIVKTYGPSPRLEITPSGQITVPRQLIPPQPTVVSLPSKAPPKFLQLSVPTATGFAISDILAGKGIQKAGQDLSYAYTPLYNRQAILDKQTGQVNTFNPTAAIQFINGRPVYTSEILSNPQRYKSGTLGSFQTQQLKAYNQEIKTLQKQPVSYSPEAVLQKYPLLIQDLGQRPAPEPLKLASRALTYSNPVTSSIAAAYQSENAPYQISRSGRITQPVPLSSYLSIGGAVLGAGSAARAAMNEADRILLQQQMEQLAKKPIKYFEQIDPNTGKVSLQGIQKSGNLERKYNIFGEIKQTESGKEFIPDGTGRFVTTGIVKGFPESPNLIQAGTFKIGARGIAIPFKNIGDVQWLKTLGTTTFEPLATTSGLFPNEVLKSRYIKSLVKDLKYNTKLGGAVIKDINPGVGNVFRISDNLALGVTPGRDIGTIVTLPRESVNLGTTYGLPPELKTPLSKTFAEEAQQQGSIQDLLTPKTSLTPSLPTIKKGVALQASENLPRASSNPLTGMIVGESAFAGTGLYERTAPTVAPSIQPQRAVIRRGPTLSLPSTMNMLAGVTQKATPRVMQKPKSVQRLQTQNIQKLSNQQLEKLRQVERQRQNQQQRQSQQQQQRQVQKQLTMNLTPQVSPNVGLPGFGGFSFDFRLRPRPKASKPVGKGKVKKKKTQYKPEQTAFGLLIGIPTGTTYSSTGFEALRFR